MTNRLHEQLGYQYDPAGNLSTRTNNLLAQVFTVNNLNQLSNITRSGTLTVAGSFSGTPTNVTVNTSNAAWYLDGAFARTNFTPADGLNTYTSLVWNAVASNTNTITAWLPATQSFTYDSNGNLTGDGRRGYEYDDADQLIRVSETNSWKSEYTYDGKFRLRVRKEYTVSGGVTNLVSETRYIYDGMLVVQERDAGNTPTITYSRGRDLSGTMEGAGGIGGLLAMTDHSQSAASVATAYYQADANGNVTALLNTNGIVVARYAYDPFGNTLSLTGPKADTNPYRFSSKEAQTRSGLYYYGRRFYAPEWQRWVNRDPIAEAGGVNVYLFVSNDSVGGLDPIGLCGDDCPSIDAWPTSKLDRFNKGSGKSLTCSAKLTGCLDTCLERFFSGPCAKYYEPCVALCNQKKLECDLGSSSGNDLPPRAPKIEVPPPKKWWEVLKNWILRN